MDTSLNIKDTLSNKLHVNKNNRVMLNSKVMTLKSRDVEMEIDDVIKYYSDLGIIKVLSD